MRINSITYNHFNFNGLKNNSTNKNTPAEQSAYAQAPSFEASNTLKSIVLFKGNFKENKALTPERVEKLEEFQEKYNLKFNDINILSQAFCDKTYPDGSKVIHKDTYQRLEFIGDRVLDMCVTDLLSEQLPDALEGDLTGEKLKIVCNKNIANFGKRLNFEELTTHSKYLEDKKYADMFEALIGAIYVDAGGIKGDGIEKAYNFLMENFAQDFTPKTTSDGIDYFEETYNYIEDVLEKDPTKLDCTVRIKGSNFKSRVTYNKKVIARGSGESSQLAKQNALKTALEGLKSNEIELITEEE